MFYKSERRLLCKAIGSGIINSAIQMSKLWTLCGLIFYVIMQCFIKTWHIIIHFSSTLNRHDTVPLSLVKDLSTHTFVQWKTDVAWYKVHVVSENQFCEWDGLRSFYEWCMIWLKELASTWKTKYVNMNPMANNVQSSALEKT